MNKKLSARQWVSENPSIHRKVNDKLIVWKNTLGKLGHIMLLGNWPDKTGVRYSGGVSVGLYDEPGILGLGPIGAAVCAECGKSMNLSVGVEKAIPLESGEFEFIKEYYDGTKVYCISHGLSDFYIVN